MDDAEYVGAIVAPGCADYTRKQLDQLTEFVKRPQVGAKGMMWVKLENDGSIKSSVGKFYSDDELRGWLERGGANPGDLMLILAGATMKTRKQLNELRLEMGSRLGLRDPQKFSCLWVVDFLSSNGMMKRSATMPCIIRSLRLTRRMWTSSTPIPVLSVPQPMTW